MEALHQCLGNLPSWQSHDLFEGIDDFFLCDLFRAERHCSTGVGYGLQALGLNERAIEVEDHGFKWASAYPGV